LRGAFFPSAHRTTDKSNGRIQTHRILTTEVTAEEIDFPFASQICLIRHNREHWGIENKLHHTRDTTYNEDRSRIRKPKGARSLASLKNLAIGLHALEIFKPPGARRETIPKMNRRITRNPQIAVNFCITPCNKHLL
jgi:hypothetical protein